MPNRPTPLPQAQPDAEHSEDDVDHPSGVSEAQSQRMPIALEERGHEHQRVGQVGEQQATEQEGHDIPDGLDQHAA